MGTELEKFTADVAFVGATLDRLTAEAAWREMGSLPRDATVLVTVVPGPAHTFPEKIKPTTHPAYIDEQGRVCDVSTWEPDKGLHGTHWQCIAWRPLPAPAEQVSA